MGALSGWATQQGRATAAAGAGGMWQGAWGSGRTTVPAVQGLMQPAAPGLDMHAITFLKTLSDHP